MGLDYYISRDNLQKKAREKKTLKELILFFQKYILFIFWDDYWSIPKIIKSRMTAD